MSFVFLQIFIKKVYLFGGGSYSRQLTFLEILPLFDLLFLTKNVNFRSKQELVVHNNSAHQDVVGPNTR